MTPIDTKSFLIRWSHRLAIAYFCIFILSIVYMFIMARVTAFCGLYALLITMPWSMPATKALSAINPSIFDSMIPGTIVVILSGLLNTALIYFGPPWLMSSGQKGEKEV